MFYQEALPKVRFLSRVDSLLTIRDRQWQKLAMFEKPTQQIHMVMVPLFVGCLFCLGAYKCDVVQNGCLYSWGLFCVGAYYPDFMVSL